MSYKKTARIITQLRFSMIIFLLAFALFSCHTKEGKKEDKQPESKNTETENRNAGWEDVRSAIVKIDSYDGDRILESGQGFFVAGNLIVAKYSLIDQANKVVVAPLDSKKKYTTE